MERESFNIIIITHRRDTSNLQLVPVEAREVERESILTNDYQNVQNDEKYFFIY